MQGLELYDDADLYDLIAPPNDAVVDFIFEEALRLGGSVLELACGTGRIAIPLAQRGLKVTGLDLHPVMLDRARFASAAANAPVRYIESDMRHFELPEKFGLIFIAYNSLLHLHEVADIKSCFTAVSRQLTQGGQFILEIFNPNPQWLALPSGERRHVGRFNHPVLGEVTVEESLDYDRAMQINRETWYWSTLKNPDFRVRPLHLRNIFPQELPLLLELGGLSLVKRYGAYDRRPFDRNSAHQICLCERSK